MQNFHAASQPHSRGETQQGATHEKEVSRHPRRHPLLQLHRAQPRPGGTDHHDHRVSGRQDQGLHFGDEDRRGRQARGEEARGEEARGEEARGEEAGPGQVRREAH